MQQPMQPEMSFFLMPQFSFSNESSMRTSKLKIDLDSTCKELKFLHVSILQTSTELANIWLQAFIPETGEIFLLPPRSMLAAPEVNTQDFGWVLQPHPTLQQVTDF